MFMKTRSFAIRGFGGAVLLFLFFGSTGILAGQENLGRGRVAGTVVDEAGAPVAGVRIVAQSLQSETTLTGTTDKKGHFAIGGFGTGPWRFTASKDGYIPAYIEMDVRQLRTNPPVNLTLNKAAGAPVATSGDTAQGDFDEAHRLFIAERFAEAAVLFEGLLARNPEMNQIYLNAGHCYLKLGDWGKATSRFQAVLDRVSRPEGSCPDNALAGKAFVGLGEVAARTGDFESAKGYFGRALKLAPEDEISAYNIAEILFSAQKVDEAIGYYEMALRIKPDWPKPVFKLGVAHLNKARYDKALEYLTRFVEMDPDHPGALQAREMIAAIKKIRS